MAFTEQTLELDNAHISNLFGQFDCYLKKLERAFGTQIIDRDGTVHIRGEQSAVAHTAAVFTELKEDWKSVGQGKSVDFGGLRKINNII